MSGTAWLSGRRPDGQAGEWPLESEQFVVGREPPADLVLPLPRISRRHALLTRVADGYYVADLDSRNGTFVNGRPVTREPVRLQDGDEIVLGGVAVFRFREPGQTVEGPRLGRLRGIWLDEAAQAVWVDAQPVEPQLSTAQFALLALLYHADSRLVTRDEIISCIWPSADPAGVSVEAVDGLIKRLRARLRANLRPGQPDYLQVLRGHGLKLVQPDE